MSRSSCHNKAGAACGPTAVISAGGGARGAWQWHCRVLALLKHCRAHFCADIFPYGFFISVKQPTVHSGSCACCMSQVGCLCGLSCLNFTEPSLDPTQPAPPWDDDNPLRANRWLRACKWWMGGQELIVKGRVGTPTFNRPRSGKPHIWWGIFTIP